VRVGNLSLLPGGPSRVARALNSLCRPCLLHPCAQRPPFPCAGARRRQRQQQEPPARAGAYLCAGPPEVSAALGHPQQRALAAGASSAVQRPESPASSERCTAGSGGGDGARPVLREGQREARAVDARGGQQAALLHHAVRHAQLAPHPQECRYVSPTASADPEARRASD
jgi:hypothetical protein